MTTEFDPKEFHEAKYWEIVRQCLVEFHHYNYPKASTEVASFKDDVSSTMKNPYLVFHEEPFYLACNLSSKQLPLSEYRDKYESVLAKINS